VRREAFLARKAMRGLAAATEEVRQAMALQLWHQQGQLLLDDWLLECACPGASSLTTNWSLIAERDADSVLLLRELVATAVSEMPAERDQEVLARRLGLNGQPAQTLEKVAEALDLSRERVRQLQARAIRRLSRADDPASRRLHQVLAELTDLEGTAPEAGPATAERLLELADVLLPTVAPRQAVGLVARLAGANKVRADNLAAEASTFRMLRTESARREAVQQRRVERAGRRWAALYGDVTWFGDPAAPPLQTELESVREENLDRDSFGVWRCPKLKRDVSYESQSELHVIQLLGLAPQIAYYQEQPLAIRYQFRGRQRTYFPDLLAATEDGRCILIEVKPVYEMATAVNAAKYLALEAFCRDRGWGLLATDGSRTRRLIEDRDVDPQLETVLAEALDRRGELSWPQVRAVIGILPMTALDLSALILKCGWEWDTRPYRLRRRPPPERAAATPEPHNHTPARHLAQESPLVTDLIKVPSPAEIEAARTPAGGWTRQQLAAWGVSWPPPKGWRQQLVMKWHEQ